MDVRFLPSVDGIEAADLAGFGDVLYTKGFLQFAEAEQRGRVEPHHLTLVRDGRLGCAVVVLPFVSETNTALRHALTATGFVECFHEADFHFDTAFATYEGFVAALPVGVRKQYRADRAAMEEAGVRQTLPRLAALVEGVSLFVASRGGQVVGYVLNVHDAHTFHCLRCGQAYEALERANVYFNLVFATSARKAIELGCRHVSFGKAGHRGKLLRGCRYTRGLACFRFVDPAVHEAMRPALRRVNDRKLAAFDATGRLR